MQHNRKYDQKYLFEIGITKINFPWFTNSINSIRRFTDTKKDAHCVSSKPTVSAVCCCENKIVKNSFPLIERFPNLVFHRDLI